MRRALLLLALFLPSCATTAPPSEVFPSAFEASCAGFERVWRIQSAIGVYGTAFPVSCVADGEFWRVTFVTAGHVVAGSDDVMLLEGHGPALPAYFGALHPDFGADRQADLGLVVAISLSRVSCVRMSFREPDFGERLTLVSFPLAMGPWVTDGRYSGEGRVSTDAFPGSSGGPVFDAGGSVVGVIVTGASGPTGPVGFMCSMCLLGGSRALLEQYEDQEVDGSGK